jgi:hypothetical protein
MKLELPQRFPEICSNPGQTAQPDGNRMSVTVRAGGKLHASGNQLAGALLSLARGRTTCKRHVRPPTGANARPNTREPMTSPFREQTRRLIPLIGMKCSRSQIKPKKAGPGSQRIPIKRWEEVDFTVPMGSALPGGGRRDCALKLPAVIRGRPPGTRVCSCHVARIRPSRPQGRKCGRWEKVDLGGRWLRRFAGR